MQQLGDSFGLKFGELFNLYMDNHGRPHCLSWKELERYNRLYLQHIQNMPADSLRRFDVQQIHTRLGDDPGPTTANRVVELIRMIYNKGIEWELVQNNPGRGIKKYRLQSRERFLETDELTRFFAAVETLRYQTTRDFLLLCLATGARRSNVAAMRWQDVCLERATWCIPMTKNGSSHLLPLTAFAMQILARRKEHARNDWVFPSDRSESGHLTKPEKAWCRIMERANLKNVRIHDLRRTLASYQAMTGANLSIIAKTLNHHDMKSTQIYARLQIDPVRKAMETATNAMLKNV